MHDEYIVPGPNAQRLNYAVAELLRGVVILTLAG